MLEFTRICPNCNLIINYTNKRSYKKANEKNSNCKTCNGKINGEKCKGKINYKNRTGENIKCHKCGKIHYKSFWNLKKDKKHFCSSTCADSYHSKLMTKYDYPIKTCAFCSNSFQTKINRKKYCSVKCASSANLKTINQKIPKNKKTRPELEFKKILEDKNVNFVFQKDIQWKNGWKKWYDFYIPNGNILIEIDGIYWHGKNIPTKNLNKQQWNTRKNDKLKNYLAKIRGYKLIRIWSDEVKNINIKQILKHYE